MGKAEAYVRARLAGLGTRAAAREAGFVDGRPSQDARDLWRRLVALRDTPGLLAALKEEQAKLDKQRAKLDEAESAHRAWDRAVSLLEGWPHAEGHPA